MRIRNISHLCMFMTVLTSTGWLCLSHALRGGFKIHPPPPSSFFGGEGEPKIHSLSRETQKFPFLDLFNISLNTYRLKIQH